jgi:hypothetical protein
MMMMIKWLALKFWLPWFVMNLVRPSSLTPICLAVGPNLSYGEPKASHGVPRHYELGKWREHSSYSTKPSLVRIKMPSFHPRKEYLWNLHSNSKRVMEWLGQRELRGFRV